MAAAASWAMSWWSICFCPPFAIRSWRIWATRRCSIWAAAALAMSTDSFVVQPLFFPGGSIGELAVNGTVNDLAVSGAEPKFLSASFILEEGFPLSQLAAIVEDMARAAARRA